MSDGQENRVQIQVDEETSHGIYANFAMINHSETEFLLDFVFLQPHVAKAKVRARIISSPKHAKRFAKALLENIAKYEARFGPIDDGAPGPTKVDVVH